MPVCLSVILFDLHARLILNWLKNEGTPASSHTRDVSPTGYLLSASCRISALATCYPWPRVSRHHDNSYSTPHAAPPASSPTRCAVWQWHGSFRGRDYPDGRGRSCFYPSSSSDAPNAHAACPPSPSKRGDEEGYRLRFEASAGVM